MRLLLAINLSHFAVFYPKSEVLSHFLDNRLDAFNLFALHVVEYALQLRTGNGCIGVPVVNINISDLRRIQATLLAKETKDIARADLILLSLTYI